MSCDSGLQNYFTTGTLPVHKCGPKRSHFPFPKTSHVAKCVISCCFTDGYRRYCLSCSHKILFLISLHCVRMWFPYFDCILFFLTQLKRRSFMFPLCVPCRFPPLLTTVTLRLLRTTTRSFAVSVYLVQKLLFLPFLDDNRCQLYY